MLSLELLRNHPNIILESNAKRGVSINFDQLIQLDTQIRTLKHAIDQKQSILNANSKTKPTLEITAQNKLLGQEIHELKGEYDTLFAQFTTIFNGLPNLVSPHTPEGLTEEDNIEVKRFDAPNKLNAHNIPHYELEPNFIDKETGANLAGSRFVVLKDRIAKLARVLANWLLDENTQAGYSEISVPYMMNPEIAYGMGVLPKFREDLFETTTGHFLIPTAEACLVSLHTHNPIEALPKLYTAHTPCFRSEAGSAGKDNAGIVRLHQFHKVEIVGFVDEEQVDHEHNRLVAHVEYLLQKLGLSYRILSMCAGDLGFHAYKKFDLEVWMPGLNRYLEISSCSQCHEFQSRRMQLKKVNKKFPHTINGSALPIERTICALIENKLFTENTLPDCLKKYW